MIWLLEVLLGLHVLGMLVPGLAILIGDLWEGEPYAQQVKKLLFWEWYMALELIGEKP